MHLTNTQAIILTLLVNRGKSYGLELVKNSDGRLKRGTVYVLLQRLEEKGFVTSELEAPKEGQLGPPRRTYEATGHGARVLDAWRLYREVGALRLGGAM